MGIYSGLVGGSSGYGDPKINPQWRDEIPQWFYENCYEISQKVLSWSESDARLIVHEQKATARCSASGWGPVEGFSPGEMWEVELDIPTWVKWQEILIVPFGTRPKPGDRMAFYGNRHHNLWTIREHALCGGRYSHSELCGEGGTAREAVFHQPTSIIG